MQNPFRILCGLSLGLAVAGCTNAPMGFGGPVSRPSPTMSAPQSTDAPIVSASRAEQACIDAGRERGLNVQGVISTRDVAGTDGQLAARDVMLRVSRDGTQIELRCNYQIADDLARIMLI